MKLNEIRLFRRIILPLLARLNPGDIRIRHHYTGQRIKLHSFHHKGYWYLGRKREQESMALFARLIGQGDTVIEVGGHIGYISLYFRQLAETGRVIVFEPGENNLPYIRHNIAGRGIELVEKAAGDHNGMVSFYGSSGFLVANHPTPLPPPQGGEPPACRTARRAAARLSSPRPSSPPPATYATLRRPANLGAAHGSRCKFMSLIASGFTH